jgi:TRAP-type C4-dicarboxylate transport system permease small subunit
MGSLRRLYDRFLEAIAVLLIVGVTGIVVAGFVFRWLGYSLVWYDEIASISLVWLTYYAGALAALRGAHIGFSGFVNSLSANLRVAATLFASAVSIGFFAVLAWTGWQVVQILGGDTLVSVPAIPQRLTQSVIPIASALFVIAELIRLPDALAEARCGPIVDHEIKDALEAVNVAPITPGEKPR